MSAAVVQHVQTPEQQELQAIRDAVLDCCMAAGISTTRTNGVRTGQDVLLYLQVFKTRFRQDRLFNYRPTR